ncbi:MAG TPA: response regulator, partial [Usitatibacter sp.]
MGARVLIIEDNATNLELMRYLLAAFGHLPIAARAGEEGLRMAASETPDIIICDVQMPGIDGFEVLQRLRATASLAKVPVIAVTALAMVGDREKVLEAGFDGYISKPIEPTAFVPQVEAFIRAELHGSRPRHDPAAPPAARTRQSDTGRAILVVDNNRTNLDFASSLFEMAGYRVMGADGARQALRLARETRPGLILSDVRMSGESGYDLIRAIKQDVELAKIPFVFLTSTFTSAADRREGLALGAARFLFRPIEARDLLAEIEAVFA